MLKDALDLFEKWAKANHLPDWFIDYVIKLAVPGIILLVLLWWLYKFILILFRYRNQKIINSNLSPFYTNLDTHNSTRFYIQTKFQNISPSEDEEPGGRYIASAKEKLLPLFINKVFNNRKTTGKYFLILADSGMGKTTFLINLFIRYKNLIHFPWSVEKHNIELVPLAHSDFLDKINSINDKGKTILLLDSFDENVEAAENYKRKLDQIIKATYDFKFVIITCRTQFFPNQAEEPYETGYFSYGDSGEYKFQKIYISPFNEKDVKKYLFKKFNFLNPFKTKIFFRAYSIVKKCPYLMVRPMLLSHIEDLVKVKKPYVHSYEIYQALVNKWIQREASKPHIKRKYGSFAKYAELLLKFSKALAIDLFINREKRGGYFIHKDEDFSVDGLSISHIDDSKSKLSLFEKKTKSLLNRNAEGFYKFSHKSILEYLLAEQIITNKWFNINVNQGMDISIHFQKELLVSILQNVYGFYSITIEKSIDSFTPFSNINYKEVESIKHIFISNFSDLDPCLLGAFKSLETVLVADNLQLSPLYQIYSQTIRLVNNKNWKNYHNNDHIKNKLLSHFIFNLSNQISEEEFPFVHAHYKSLEASMIILEVYMVPGMPQFSTYLHDRAEEIKKYKNQWDMRQMIIKLSKSIPKFDNETHNYLTRLNIYLKELKEMKLNYPTLNFFY